MSATKLREKVNSIADLRLLVNIPVGKVIETDSYYGDGNGGGNTFVKVVTGAQVDNGGTIIVGADLGVYEAIDTSVVTVKQFGGGTGAFDQVDTDAFQAAIDFVEANTVVDGGFDLNTERVTKSIYLEGGTYLIKGTLELKKSGHHIYGQGMQTKIINSRGQNQYGNDLPNKVYPSASDADNLGYLTTKDLFKINPEDSVTGLADELLTGIIIENIYIDGTNFDVVHLQDTAEEAKPMVFNVNYTSSCVFRDIMVTKSRGATVYERSTNTSSLTGCLKNKYENIKIENSVTSWMFILKGSIAPLLDNILFKSVKHGVLLWSASYVKMTSIYMEALIHGYFDYDPSVLNTFSTAAGNVVFDDNGDVNNNFMTGVRMITSSGTLDNFKFESVIGASIYQDNKSKIDIDLGINEGGVLYNDYTKSGKIYTGNTNGYITDDFGLFDSNKSVPKLPRSPFYLYGQANVGSLGGGVGTYLVTGQRSRVNVVHSTNYYGKLANLNTDIQKSEIEKTNELANSYFDAGNTNIEFKLEDLTNVPSTSESNGFYGNKSVNVDIISTQPTITTIPDSYTDINSGLTFDADNGDVLNYAFVLKSNQVGLSNTVSVVSETSVSTVTSQKRPSVAFLTDDEYCLYVVSFGAKHSYLANGTLEFTDTSGFFQMVTNNDGQTITDQLDFDYVSCSNFNVGVLNTGIDTTTQQKPVKESYERTGTEVDLSSVAGYPYNMSSASSSEGVGAYTTVYPVIMGNAICLINTPTEAPQVTGATLTDGATWVANTDMYMVVWSPDGTNTEYYFLTK